MLRLADENDYLMLDTGTDVLGMPHRRPAGASLDGKDVQVAVLGGAANVAQQAKAIERFAVTLRGRGVAGAPAIRRLPEVVRVGELAATAARTGWSSGWPTTPWVRCPSNRAASS